MTPAPAMPSLIAMTTDQSTLDHRTGEHNGWLTTAGFPPLQAVSSGASPVPALNIPEMVNPAGLPGQRGGPPGMEDMPSADQPYDHIKVRSWYANNYRGFGQEQPAAWFQNQANSSASSPCRFPNYCTRPLFKTTNDMPYQNPMGYGPHY